MPKGIAVTIGLNAVDPVHYQGWSGELIACEADANDLARIAKSKGFAVTNLLTKQATRTSVSKSIADAAGALKADDLFFLSYSGHGGQLPDLNADEDDREDETWCLYDGELVDDEIYAALGGLTAGVRVLVFSDSCHSGTVTKAAYYAGGLGASLAMRMARGVSAPASEPRFRMMPPDVAHRTYEANKDMYDPILKNKKVRGALDNIKASVLLISGCQDNQLSADGTFNGLFTGTLKTVWNGGKFKKPYRNFHAAIVRQMPPDQTPNFYWVGAPHPAFEKQRPFTI